MNPTRLSNIKNLPLPRTITNSVNLGLKICSWFLLTHLAAAAQSNHEPSQATATSTSSRASNGELKLTNLTRKLSRTENGYRPIDRSQFRPASAEEQSAIESYMLEIEVASQLAEQIGFLGRGNYCFASHEDDHDAISLRQFAVGWAIDNTQDRERILLVSQEQLPAPVHQAFNSTGHSSNSHLDQLRIERRYHETNGPMSYPAGDTSRLKRLLENEGLCFPYRAAISHPLDCWSGRSLERRLSHLDIKQIAGVQKVGSDVIALFKFRPSSHYVYYITILFSNRHPTQTDFWRRILPREKTPTASESSTEDQGLTQATHVATTLTSWTENEPLHLPVSIVSRTTHEAQTIEFTSVYEWFVNDAVSPTAFIPDSVGVSAPFEMFEKSESQKAR